ncbi:hypothetical protein [Cellulosimicrobium arenosum]|uniref:Uncharacterized protein n=1 Tax=Cellulosimicrobium arenosum TaxID=2708133 RepID=A0A927J0U4_9MICO|nr:hypothetical protein [Cellulosimicrobium arenosum]MBD8079796.1 hypothetical protein [Cellulosimicrobium arenosum]
MTTSDPSGTADEPTTAQPGAEEPTPDGSSPDEAFARLRAADPASVDEPDADAIAAAVAARLVTGDDLAGRRAERVRRRAPWQVAAAVAGAVALGGGGYALGAGAAGPSSTSDAAVVGEVAQLDGPIRLESSIETGASAAAGDDAGGPRASGPAESTVAGTSADSTTAGPWWGRTVFHQEGLSTQGDSAEGWAYDAAGVFSPETAQRAADVLGVEGAVREDYGSLALGSPDWTGPALTLAPDGLASLSFSDPTGDPWSCAEQVVGEDAATEGDCARRDLGAAPAPDEAVGDLRGTLVELGVDVDAYELVGSEQDGGDVRVTNVTAHEVVDGQRTGVTWDASYAGTGLFQLYGPLAPRVDLGGYDVVSPAEAVGRLGDPRFASGGPVAYAETLRTSMPTEGRTPTVPPTVGAGSPIAWPVADVTIADARLGLAVQYQPDGAAVLVPAYELSDAQGTTWSVVAVADDQLDFSTD